MACASRAGWCRGRAGADRVGIRQDTGLDSPNFKLVNDTAGHLRSENEDELLATADRAMYRVESLRRDA